MRSLTVVLALITVLAGGVVAGCGSSSSSSATTATSTVPDGRLGASAAPPKLGYYAGVECAHHTCTYLTQAGDAFRAYCNKGVPNAKLPSSYTDPHGNEYNFVCFQLKSSNNLVNFYFAGQKIVNSVYVSTDRFPLTCDNGWCIAGEWFSTTRVNGSIRNPRGVSTQYVAQWYAS